jgi:hypothetical protein
MKIPAVRAPCAPTMIVEDLSQYDRAIGRIHELLAAPDDEVGALELAALCEAVRAYEARSLSEETRILMGRI